MRRSVSARLVRIVKIPQSRQPVLGAGQPAEHVLANFLPSPSGHPHPQLIHFTTKERICSVAGFPEIIMPGGVKAGKELRRIEGAHANAVRVKPGFLSAHRQREVNPSVRNKQAGHRYVSEVVSRPIFKSRLQRLWPIDRPHADNGGRAFPKIKKSCPGFQLLPPNPPFDRGFIQLVENLLWQFKIAGTAFKSQPMVGRARQLGRGGQRHARRELKIHTRPIRPNFLRDGPSVREPNPIRSILRANEVFPRRNAAEMIRAIAMRQRNGDDLVRVH